MRTTSCLRAAGRVILILAGLMTCARARPPGPQATPDRASASPANTIPLSAGGALRYSAQGNQTVVEVIPAAKRANEKRIALKRDQTVAPKSPVEVKLLSEVGKQVVIVADTYASKPGSMSYCQAGQEEFLRVLTIESRMRETFHLKLQSCIASLELASPGVVWKPESSTLEIHWLSGPGPNEHNQSRSYRINDRGEVRPVETTAR